MSLSLSSNKHLNTRIEIEPSKNRPLENMLELKHVPAQLSSKIILSSSTTHSAVYPSQNERYLNKKQTAEEMEQLYQAKFSVDYSLKEGQTLVLQIKNKGSSGVKSTLFERLNRVSLEDKPTVKEGGLTYLKPPPAPPAPPSPVCPVERSSHSSPASNSSPNSTTDESEKIQVSVAENPPIDPYIVTEAGAQGTAEDDFGDFQAAG